MAKDADAPMKPKEVKSESRTKTKTVYKTVYKTGKKTGKKTDEDEIPRSRKQRAIAAEQPELMDMTLEAENNLKDIDLIFPIFQNRFWPPPQNQPQNPQQPQFFPQPQNPQQPLQRRPLLFPNLRLNAQQQANAKQLAASAAQYGQAILSALLHSTLPNAALADSIAAAAGGGATDLASTFIKNHAEPEAEEAPAAEAAEPAAEPEA